MLQKPLPRAAAGGWAVHRTGGLLDAGRPLPVRAGGVERWRFRKYFRNRLVAPRAAAGFGLSVELDVSWIPAGRSPCGCAGRASAGSRPPSRSATTNPSCPPWTAERTTAARDGRPVHSGRSAIWARSSAVNRIGVWVVAMTPLLSQPSAYQMGSLLGTEKIARQAVMPSRNRRADEALRLGARGRHGKKLKFSAMPGTTREACEIAGFLRGGRREVFCHTPSTPLGVQFFPFRGRTPVTSFFSRLLAEHHRRFASDKPFCP